MADYKCITDLQEISDYLNGKTEVSFDFETSPTEVWRETENAALDPHKSEITGISLSVQAETGIYIPLRHRVGENAQKMDDIFNYLRSAVFSNRQVVKVAHNLAFEAAFLYKQGVIVQPPVYDTIAAAQLTLKSDKEFRSLSDSGLKTLLPCFYDTELPTFTEVTAGRYFDELDPGDPDTVRYACADADYALRLYYLFNEWFDRFLPKHRYICKQIESPTAVYTGLMKYNGLLVDKELMFSKQREAEDKLVQLSKEIHLITGDIDLGANASTAAFKNYLYEDLGLPVLKTTAKYREAADDEALILLKDWCLEHRPELVCLFELVQEYRKWGKIKSTYIDGYLKYINPETGSIHPELFPLGTDTGRFACRKPNLQNIGRPDSDPVGARNFFIARPGHVFLDFDFSQIELRVGAYFCRDEKMMETYSTGGDIHARTTSVIYKIPFDQAVDKNAEHYKERRTIAKNCNFGVFYGLFPRGLQRTLKFKAGLNTQLSECEEIIRNLKSGYPGLVRWQNDVKKRAGFRKYTETALGRRRYLKGIDSTDWGVKSYWERCALNTPIQGTAADILKLALGRILEGLPDRPWLKPLLQVHDELLFEVPKDKVQEAASFIKQCMEQVPFDGFDVPVVAEGAVGSSFGKLKEMEVI